MRLLEQQWEPKRRNSLVARYREHIWRQRRLSSAELSSRSPKPFPALYSAIIGRCR
jgi:hypothetical protein